MADTATLEARLAGAETALHELAIGKAAVRVAYDGKDVTFTASNAGVLRAYIAELKSQLGISSRRPLRPCF